MTERIPVIAVDGPSGVGKGTLCQALADKLGWHLLDSGAIYRVLALAALVHQVDIASQSSLVPLATHLDVHFSTQNGKVRIILEGEDVTDEIRKETVGNTASKIAVFPEVREALLYRQRNFRVAPGLVADGRDMGTIVFPDAKLKIFLDAAPEARAERRMKQLQEKGFSGKFDHLLDEIKQRDERDRNRAVAPLVPADDAIVIDTTSMNIEDVLEKVLVYVKKVYYI